MDDRVKKHYIVKQILEDPVANQIRVKVEFLAKSLKEKIDLEAQLPRLEELHAKHMERLNDAEGYASYKKELREYLEKEGMLTVFHEVIKREANPISAQKALEKKRIAIKARIETLDEIVLMQKEDIKALKNLYNNKKRLLNYSSNVLRAMAPEQYSEASNFYTQYKERMTSKPTEEDLHFAEFKFPALIANRISNLQSMVSECENNDEKLGLVKEIEQLQAMLEIRSSNWSLFKSMAKKVDPKYMVEPFLTTEDTLTEFGFLSPVQYESTEKQLEPYKRYIKLLAHFDPKQIDTLEQEKLENLRQKMKKKLMEQMKVYNKRELFHKRQQRLTEIVKI